METESDQPSETERPPTEQKGKLLRPATQGVQKQALQHYLVSEPDFVGAYFPLVLARKHATYGDIFELTERQADAFRPIMVESILHFRRLDGRERSRNTDLLKRTPIDSEFVSMDGRKAKYWTEALRELCEVFGLESPL